MANPTADVCMLYYPPSIELPFNQDMENSLAADLKKWKFFKCCSSLLSQLGIDLSRYCSLDCDISYEQRSLLHHHTTWIFSMDEVSEKLPLYGLHKTAGKMCLENLKAIMRDGDFPMEDMMQFKGSCPDELLRSVLDAQRILVEGLMPLKRELLSPYHVQMCIETLDLYFDNQYYEGLHFSKQTRVAQIIKTRAFTIGSMILPLLYMPSVDAEIWVPNNPCAIQLGLFVAYFNDLVGIYKDMDSLERGDDASAYLNVVLRGLGITLRGNIFLDKFLQVMA